MPAATTLVIFDCDGVLVDSEPAANRVFHAELRRVGVEMSLDEVLDTFVGLSMKRCAEWIAERRGTPLPDGFFAEVEEKTFAEFRRELQPVRGVVAALDALDASTVPTCVASSGEHRKMRLTLGLTGLLERFEGRLFSATEVTRGKPHPDLYLHAAARCDFEPADCVVVEDSVPGVQGAVAAGMRVLGYAERSNPRRLAAEGATVFTAMEQLPALVQGEVRSG